MDRDQLTELIHDTFEDYVKALDDLNDIDSQDLAENIAAAIERTKA